MFCRSITGQNSLYDQVICLLLVPQSSLLLPYGHRAPPVQRTIDVTLYGDRTVSLPAPYGRHVARSQAPYDIIQEFLTVATRRLEICDRAGYGRHGIVRCRTKTKIARFRW